jgi:glutamine cyclotransferase
MNSITRRLVVAVGLAALPWSLGPARPALTAQSRAVVDGYRVVNVYPHDPEAYTQGLIYRNGFLFESTGLNGRSTVRKVSWKRARSSSSIVSIRPTSQKP